MQQFLSQCREKLGPAPRRFSFWDRMFYLRVPTPFWMMADSTDKLQNFFWYYKDVLKDGFVTWGQIVQANGQLFQAGSQNCPGEVVYCPQPEVAVSPRELREVAGRLYDLKGEQFDDPEVDQIAQYLANERVRVFGLAVPPSIAGPIPCALSTVFFVRKHLPGGRLASTLMPVIVAKRNPRVVMVLPGRFWPDELAERWEAGADDESV